MLVFFNNNQFCFGNEMTQLFVVVLGIFLPALHQFQAEGKTQKSAYPVIFPDFPLIRVHILQRVLAPDLIMTEFLISDLFQHLAVFGVFCAPRQPAVNVILRYFIFLKNQKFPADLRAGIHFKILNADFHFIISRLKDMTNIPAASPRILSWPLL